MPANHPKPGSQAPASPRNTAKYTNKDGSKFITVPKGTTSESSQPSTPTASKPSTSFSEHLGQGNGTGNRKKQKRRLKAAATLKANPDDFVADHNAVRMLAQGTNDYEVVNSEDDEGNEYVLGPQRTTNGDQVSESKSKKGKKKKKKKAGTLGDMLGFGAPEALPQPGAGKSRDKIWSTSNQEERERIKDFWLNLGEDDRKSLVKVEKDAVLKKMKEQQKHTCSCTVCGRKRSAIEEELEGLYDAYYLELEQFANQPEGPLLAPPRDRELPAQNFPEARSFHPHQTPSRGRIVEHVGDEDDEDEPDQGFSDEDGDEDFSEDEPPEEYQEPHDRDVADFLTFGNSLQVKGGILTVADDLLKNDGRRFIEMMEQLAERRIAREGEATREHFARGYNHPNGSYPAPHSHPQDDYEDDEDEEDEEGNEEEISEERSQDGDYEEEEDPMTEEQRMEEGRRMFQIFAARMFEQRVLSAYKEKVAKERQAKLLEELEEEDRKEDEQKAKKAKNAAKKKEKAAQKKQAAAEEKARKDAEKAAEEATRVENEQRRVAEQRQKAEERKKQKEALKKAEEEARLRKEAERQRRVHEQREKQAELERKAREAKDKEKKLKEEQRLKEIRIRELKERESLERKEKQERDKQEKEARAAKALKEAQEAKEARDKLKEEKVKEEKAAQRAVAQPQQPSPSAAKRSHQAPVSVPTVLPQHPSNPANFVSPKVPVATPVIPKAPTPMRPRTLSQQHDSGLQSSSASHSGSTPNQDPLHIVNFDSPAPRHRSPGLVSGPPRSPHIGLNQAVPMQMPHIGMQPPPGLTHHPPPPGFTSRITHNPMLPPGFQPAPTMMVPPPGIGSPVGRVFSPVPMPPPGFPQAPGEHYHAAQGYPIPKDTQPSHPTHVRHGSASYDAAPGPPAQPIGRPAPIGRPKAMAAERAANNEEDETQHLGSRALLDDDEPLAPDVNLSGSWRTQAPGPRPGFTPGSFAEPGFKLAHNPWGSSATPSVFAPPGLGNATWGAPDLSPSFNMASPVASVPSLANVRPVVPSVLAVRSTLTQACKEYGDAEGYVNFNILKEMIEDQYGVMADHELNDLLDTDNNNNSVGGGFDIKYNNNGRRIRWLSALGDGLPAHSQALSSLGLLGSPVPDPTSVRGT